MRALQVVTAILLSGLFLSGCGASGDFADLDQFMDEVDSRPRGRIEPLPPLPTIAPFAYQASTKRSPFEPPIKVRPPSRTPDGRRVTPDQNRVKQYLEQFPIGQLSMVGTLAQSGVTFALVKDGDGGVHRVQRGDYMGTDHGSIQSVNETSIELIEIVPDGTGGWVERERTVALGSGA